MLIQIYRVSESNEADKISKSKLELSKLIKKKYASYMNLIKD